MSYKNYPRRETQNMPKKAKSQSTLTPEQKQEQEDKKTLADANSKIEQIIQLIAENHDREKSHEKVERAKDGLQLDLEGQEKDRLKGSVFHPFKGKRVALKLRNSRLLELADALDLKFKTHSHGEDLQKALSGQILRKIKALERQIERLIK